MIEIDNHFFMTVGELMEALKQLPPDLPVIHEGCDCDGYAKSVESYENNDGGEDRLHNAQFAQPVAE
jgi:hypothetical protein